RLSLSHVAAPCSGVGGGHRCSSDAGHCCACRSLGARTLSPIPGPPPPISAFAPAPAAACSPAAPISNKVPRAAGVLMILETNRAAARSPIEGGGTCVVCVPVGITCCI